VVFLEESGKVNTSRDCMVEPEGLLSAVDLNWPVVVVEWIYISASYYLAGVGASTT
jgi:hypothetical protein